MLKELCYPLDSNYVLRKKKSLKKKLEEFDILFEKRVAILGGSTTNEIKNILELFLLNVRIKPTFYESGFNNYYEEALFDTDKLLDFKPDIIIIHTTIINIENSFDTIGYNSDVGTIIDTTFNKFHSIWRSLSKFDCPIIQNNFDFPHARNLGNFDNYNKSGKTYIVNKLNLLFSDAALKNNNLFINDINYLSSHIGIQNWFDLSLWLNARYALSLVAIPELAQNICNIINAVVGNNKKCLVLDLDNTCWGGVIADEGLEGIKIGHGDALSEAFTSFQMFVKELKKRGVTICVCSKNDFDIAKQGFEHPESILNFDDITLFKANWDPKDQNIREIANELNIGLDSIVFIDDNPFEREIVNSQIPSVCVPHVGNVLEFSKHIIANGYFEPIFLTDDDKKRNIYYKENQKRQNQLSKYSSYTEFLNSLKMVAEIKEFSSFYTDRITQLANKTNQFNLTTKRYTVSEIERITSNPRYISLYGKLSDIYGDNGLIALIIASVSAKKCSIDLFLMSCRVLKRDMEFAMFDQFINLCKAKGILEIIGYYNESSKNKMVSNLFNELGFNLIKKQDKDTMWHLYISNYKSKNKTIKVNNE